MFKKAVAVSLIALLFLCFHVQGSKPLFYSYADSFEVYLVDGSFSSNIKQCDYYEFISTKNIKGEACKINADNFDLDSFIKSFNARVVFVEELDEVVVYYAFSPEIKYLECVRGECVNLHVAVRKGQVTVGAPLIYGSF